MILLCDEDVGTGVPRALRLVNCGASYLLRLGLAGRPDTEWLALAGKEGWLAFSFNKRILKVPVERETIVRERVGIVFMTSGQVRSRNTLRLLLNRWDTLEALWETTERPFARFLSPTGRLLMKYRDYELVG